MFTIKWSSWATDYCHTIEEIFCYGTQNFFPKYLECTINSGTEFLCIVVSSGEKQNQTYCMWIHETSSVGSMKSVIHVFE